MGDLRKTVLLNEHYNRFITAQLESGRYNNVSEVVRAGLRALEDHETRLAHLRADIDAGLEALDTGDVLTLDAPSNLAQDIITRGIARSHAKP
ncbi:type II toxin-antitoxin system ParD family antitoxin [Woodsholea maritima]|uniref:type II toxin-antitoxin system ParD family antitoxin n=1 Tax=Woodsholea maritima TaxID=240237 RepID=UPI00036EF36E|nr:type II toxin-antitoxin system ParD family antitoxin [Woodsholea maritima]